MQPGIVLTTLTIQMLCVLQTLPRSVIGTVSLMLHCKSTSLKQEVFSNPSLGTMVTQISEPYMAGHFKTRHVIKWATTILQPVKEKIQIFLHPPSNYMCPLCILPTAASCNLCYTLSLCIHSLLLVLTERRCHSVGSIWE